MLLGRPLPDARRRLPISSPRKVQSGGAGRRQDHHDLEPERKFYSGLLQTAVFCASGTHVPSRTLRSGSRNPPFSLPRANFRSGSYKQARGAADDWFALQEKIGAAAPAQPFGQKLTLDLDGLRDDVFTVAHAMIDYVEWKKLAASPSYSSTIITHTNNYILPLLGSLPAQEMTGIHFQEWVRTCLEMDIRRGARKEGARIRIETMSAEKLRRRKKTINQVITILRDALQMA